MKQQITPTASKILSMVWKRDFEKHEYLEVKYVYHVFDEEEISEAFKHLNANLIQENDSGGKPYYYITFLGILLSEEGQDFIALLSKYLGYAKEIFHSDPSRDSVTEDEVKTKLHLSQEQFEVFSWLVMRSPFHTNPVTSVITSRIIGLPKEIHKLKRIEDFSGYIQDTVMKQYDPNLPMGMIERMQYEWPKFGVPEEIGIKKELEQKFKILWSSRQAALDFERYLAEAKEWDNPIAVFFIDIDNFKALNTRFTETVVDKTILVDAQKLLKKLVQFKGGAYRQGGEEFVVITPNLDPKEAMEFGEKIRGTIDRTNFQVEGHVEHCTVSVGVALWPKNGTTYQEVIEAANNAEKEAKRNRNTVKLSGGE